jgi:hypothetical protein
MVDRDGDRRDEIIIDFGTPFGLWQYANAVWGHVHASSRKILLEGWFH